MKNLILIYIFVFGCLFTLSAKQQPTPKDCVKHPQIVKPSVVEKSKVTAPEKIVKSSRLGVTKEVNSNSYFSVFNFINLFYSKDTLDNMRVM